MPWGRRPTSVIVDICFRRASLKTLACTSRRQIHYDGRQRLSNCWMPTSVPAKGKNKTSNIHAVPQQDGSEDANGLLVKAGFLRQVYSGIFHLLPLGLRVQEKLEKLIDKHMRSIGASKISLSSISSEGLWEQTGRLEQTSEFFTFEDRKGSKFLLSPTHEEEITQLVGYELKSYRDLPLRLYQISRKYRDEKRPRQGLLRGREFLMKDLYTFDMDEAQAHATYEEVRAAYANLFDELKVPYIVAKADSGNMGGDLSHEYHFPSEKGEDDIISCGSCDYVCNEEFVLTPKTTEKDLATSGVAKVNQNQDGTYVFPEHINRFPATTSDGSTLVEAYCAKPREINPYIIKAVISDVDLSRGVAWNRPAIATKGEPITEQANEQAVSSAKLLFDKSVSPADREVLREHFAATHTDRLADSLPISEIVLTSNVEESLSLTKAITGDSCPECSTGTLTIQKAIEVGHTFHLGTRYSTLLNATIAIDPSSSSPTSLDATTKSPDQQPLVPVQMGCHGIGLSRLLAAIPSALLVSSSSTTTPAGLNWPRIIAPFDVVIVPGKGLDEAAVTIYDTLSQPHPSTPDSRGSPQGSAIDVVLDDRPNKDLIWKLKDADLIGVPVVIVLGKAFTGSGETVVELQCRRLGVKRDVKVEDVRAFIDGLLVRL